MYQLAFMMFFESQADEQSETVHTVYSTSIYTPSCSLVQSTAHSLSFPPSIYPSIHMPSFTLFSLVTDDLPWWTVYFRYSFHFVILPIVSTYSSVCTDPQCFTFLIQSMFFCVLLSPYPFIFPNQLRWGILTGSLTKNLDYHYLLPLLIIYLKHPLSIFLQPAYSLFQTGFSLPGCALSPVLNVLCTAFSLILSLSLSRLFTLSFSSHLYTPCWTSPALYPRVQSGLLSCLI